MNLEKARVLEFFLQISMMKIKKKKLEKNLYLPNSRLFDSCIILFVRGNSNWSLVTIDYISGKQQQTHDRGFASQRLRVVFVAQMAK